MTDDEINIRLAEIEMPLFPGTWKRNSPPPYTTDWQWCGPLLKRDIIRLEWDTAKPSRKWMAIAKGGVLVVGNDTPQVAVCRAVIAAQKLKYRGGVP